MQVKGKRIFNKAEAAEFANTVRGQYIISQALVMAHKVLKDYESDNDNFINGKAEPSNREDMELLIEAFPLYKIHDNSIWREEIKGGE